MLAAYSHLVFVALFLLSGASQSIPVQNDNGFDLNAVPVDSDHESPPVVPHHSAIDQASSSISLDETHTHPSSLKRKRNSVRIRKDPARAELETLPHYERRVQGFFEKHGIAPKINDGASSSVDAGKSELSYEAWEDLQRLKKQMGNAISKTKGAPFAAVEARLRELRSRLPDMKEKKPDTDPVLAKEEARLRSLKANRRLALRKKLGKVAVPKLRPGRRISEDVAPPSVLRVRQYRRTSALKARGKAMKRTGV
jgi:hypothetical protein